MWAVDILYALAAVVQFHQNYLDQTVHQNHFLYHKLMTMVSKIDYLFIMNEQNSIRAALRIYEYWLVKF